MSQSFVPRPNPLATHAAHDFSAAPQRPIGCRTEPPFDGKPCPMCPSVWRNFSAVTHNFLVNLDNGDRAIRKFWYLQEAVNELASFVNDETVGTLRTWWQAANDFTTQAQLHQSIHRAPAALQALKDAYAPIKALSEAHFADRRHSHGN